MLAWMDRLPKSATLFVVGDSAGPKSYDKRSDFYSLERQLGLAFASAKQLPTKHYSRKNLGYLLAVQAGTEVLYETDDDNLPLSTWEPRLESTVEADTVSASGWINAFAYFTKEKIWPRGLPLDEILTPVPSLVGRSGDYFAPIQQGLADGEPDVDAIWRLVFDQKVVFQRRSSVFLGKGAWCPFNSQSTWWHRPAFPLLYLPSFCSFRMTDIWRSFVAQRCLWEMDAGVAIHAAEVEQVRNAHVIFRDFEKETEGYLKNKALALVLEKTPLRSRDALINVVHCYEALVAAGFFPKDELALVAAWARDLESALVVGTALGHNDGDGLE